MKKSKSWRRPLMNRMELGHERSGGADPTANKPHARTSTCAKKRAGATAHTGAHTIASRHRYHDRRTVGPRKAAPMSDKPSREKVLFYVRRALHAAEDRGVISQAALAFVLGVWWWAP